MRVNPSASFTVIAVIWEQAVAFPANNNMPDSIPRTVILGANLKDNVTPSRTPKQSRDVAEETFVARNFTQLQATAFKTEAYFLMSSHFSWIQCHHRGLSTRMTKDFM